MTTNMISELDALIRAAKNVGYHAGLSNSNHGMTAVKNHAATLDAETRLETLKQKFFEKYRVVCPV